MSDEDVKRQRQVFDSNVQSFLGAAITSKEMASDPDMVDANTSSFELYEDDNDGPQDHVPDIDDADPDTYNQYVGAEVELLQGDRVMTGKVKRRKTNPDGMVQGRAISNPILDSRTYDMEFPDGQTVKYSANIIAQNMYSQCNTEGNQYLLLKGIVDWEKTIPLSIAKTCTFSTVLTAT